MVLLSPELTCTDLALVKVCSLGREQPRQMMDVTI